MSLFGLVKKLGIVIVLVSIVVPIRYGSIDVQYISIRLLHSMLSFRYMILGDQSRPTLSADFLAFESIIRMKPPSDDDSSIDPLVTIEKLRSSFTLSSVIPKPSQCQIKEKVIDFDNHSVQTFWIENHQHQFQLESDKVLIYFHGGGYLLGDINGRKFLFKRLILSLLLLLLLFIGYSGIECHFSNIFNMSIVHVEYRLAPEHPLPAAVDDAVAVYQSLLRDHLSPSQIVLMGDSAGGGLALLTIQSLITRQLTIPAGVISLSPWTDLSASGESYIRNEKTDFMANTNNTKRLSPYLLPRNQSELSLNSSLVSPLFGSFQGFPPMYVIVATTEILADDSKGIVKKAREVGVDVTFEEGLHLLHCYPLFFTYFPEARNSLSDINKWMNTILYQK